MEGKVIIHKQAGAKKRGCVYYMTGKRAVIANWDEEGNDYPEGIKKEESIRNRFNTLDDAISYANENEYEYMTM